MNDIEAMARSAHRLNAIRGISQFVLVVLAGGLALSSPTADATDWAIVAAILAVAVRP